MKRSKKLSKKRKLRNQGQGGQGKPTTKRATRGRGRKQQLLPNDVFPRDK